MGFKTTNNKQPFAKIEEEILDFWQMNKIFQKSLDKNPKTKPYVFYDGPPFATGLPHYGHLVASLMKDAVPRYWTMKGYYVERKWGWDCHGLPIENIVEKELGFKSKQDIEKFGIDKFNQACRDKVLRYAEDWKKTINRFGRWVDMDNAYKTMDLNYMESVWWVFKELWDQGLIYEGYKSMHICPRCETTLSQQEVSEGYKDVKDLSLTAKFELASEPGTYVLAWTTTPWTLPGNVALAVGDKVDYVKVKKNNLEVGESEELYILAKARLEPIKDNYKIVDEFKGSKLVDLKYEPLFDYYKNSKLDNYKNLYSIVTADFVSTEDGTGIVHIAPAYGEDDMNLGKLKKLPFIQNVTLGGIFKDEVVDFKGLHVKPIDNEQKTDVEIIRYLAGKNLLFSKESYEHSYPHCWRCDTPLINYATSSWFVAITKIKEKMLKLAKNINWSPEHIKDGRFGQWLEGARDWSISRQRFWASCIPIWKCACGEIKVIGSVKELEELSKQKVDDLHKHSLDKITINCDKCSKEMNRIPDVLDCWFESGSMPYAQVHYPFENKQKMEAGFPAEFIAEGVDQTRAWFYYLHALSCAIKDIHAFKNVIVNGIVLAEDGKKMSKKLKNYPEPGIVIDKYGSDALRYCLLSSPVMQAENLNFSQNSVKEINQKVIILLNNVLNFYQLFNDDKITKDVLSDNILDKWILAKQEELVDAVTKEIEAYNLPKATRPIGEFIQELSTWWLRRSRDRLKSEDNKTKTKALATLHQVLLVLSKVISPFMPFLAEYVYGNVCGDKESVHLEDWPCIEDVSSNLKSQSSKLLDDMQIVREIVEKVHAIRAEKGLKVRQPLAKLKIKNEKLKTLEDDLLQIIAEEVNVKKVELADIKDELELDTNITPELKQEGLMREFVRQIQSLRKNIGLTPQDRIHIYWQSDDQDWQDSINKFTKEILSQTLAIDIDSNIKDGLEISELNNLKIAIKKI